MNEISAEERLVELEAEVARLNDLCAEWSRQNLAIVALEVQARKRSEALEAEVARVKAELRQVKTIEASAEQAKAKAERQLAQLTLAQAEEGR
jgi:hypothetical protein